MREEITRERLILLMKELARSAPRRGRFRVYLVGGGTAVSLGWRSSSIDVDLCADREDIFRDIQAIKERLNMNIEFARPEDSVPSLPGTDERHMFIETVGTNPFFHYDPNAQILSRIVRGFQRDIDDAGMFLNSKMVDPGKLQSLVATISDKEYARYPSLSRAGVEKAVEDFLDLTD